jgi:cytochrome c
MKNLLKLLLLILFTSIFFSIQSCNEDSNESNKKERPHSPWVFRSVLDLQPRMLTLALDNKLWAAYRVDKGSLYKAWDGLVNFEGPVYNQQHGPQPTTMGDAYFVNEYSEPWILLNNSNDTLKYKYDYKGHKIKDGHAIVMYQLFNEDSKIEIEEMIETEESKDGNIILKREYNITGIQEGQKLLLQCNASSIVVAQSIETNAEMTTISSNEVENNGINYLDIHYQLKMNNGINTHNIKLMNKAMVANPNSQMNELEEDSNDEGVKLIAKSDCKTCHNKNKQTIGPSYVAIANKYEKTGANISYLTKKVKEGGSGVWGSTIMSPHPTVPEADIRSMLDYILALRTVENSSQATDNQSLVYQEAVNLEDVKMSPGLVTKVFELDYTYNAMKDIKFDAKPIMGGIMPNYKNVGGSDFTNLNENFAIESQGYLNIDEASEYTFRLWSDDGSQLFIDDVMVVNHDGFHGADYKEGSIALKEGFHKLKLVFFQGLGGKFLSINMKKADEETFDFINEKNLLHQDAQREDIAGMVLPMSSTLKIPGYRNPLNTVHPSFTLSQARPDDFHPMVGGMDFLSDGRMVVSTWEASGAVYIIDGVSTGDPSKMAVKKIAEGLAEPLGLKVVDDEIYIMQKQEMTQLIDNDGDEIIDEYRTLADDWQVTANFHEFGFGLAYKDGYFYAALATGIMPGGASMNPQMPDRGKVIKVNKETGELSFIASGLRTPNGIGICYNDEIYVGDNQGDWLPSSKILKVSEGAWFGSRSVDFDGTADLKETAPLVWLPQDEIGNSPSTPLKIEVGPYKGQMIHGEVTHGGVKRVFVEEINGVAQGVVFRFIQGIEAGVNRMVWGPDGALYIGGIGNPGNWGQTGKKWYGLQRLEFNGNITFEMLAMRAKSNGVEIEFTKPLPIGKGWNPTDYYIKQWYYLPTKDYGGPKVDEKELKVKSASVSDDRKKVFLEFDGMKKGHVLYLLLKNVFNSDEGDELLSPEAWYTLTEVPTNNNGKVLKAPTGAIADNMLTQAEIDAGWELLFDGKKIDKWRNFKKESLGKSWVIKDNAVHLNSLKKDDGGWQAADGGDIISTDTYQDFELNLEWKIAACGNSGIMYNVVESDEYDYVWMTGPEMQVLDNSCHPDAAFDKHKAGDLYDMLETKFVTVNPAGEWNKVRLISNKGKVQFWLNGYNVVNYEMANDAWNELIANSKFKEWKGFGQAKSGHISLQDHGDKVWYKNIKIKKL